MRCGARPRAGPLRTERRPLKRRAESSRAALGPAHGKGCGAEDNFPGLRKTFRHGHCRPLVIRVAAQGHTDSPSPRRSRCGRAPRAVGLPARACAWKGPRIKDFTPRFETSAKWLPPPMCRGFIRNSVAFRPSLGRETCRGSPSHGCSMLEVTSWTSGRAWASRTDEVRFGNSAMPQPISPAMRCGYRGRLLFTNAAPTGHALGADCRIRGKGPPPGAMPGSLAVAFRAGRYLLALDPALSRGEKGATGKAVAVANWRDNTVLVFQVLLVWSPSW